MRLNAWRRLLCWTTLRFIGVNRVNSFEVFSEQQTLTLNDPSLIVNYNNTEYGSTHVDDYWTKLDLQYSPLEGWTLIRHVRLGCFMVQFGLATPGAYAERSDPGMTQYDCVSFCNLTQAYYQNPLCRCGIREEELFMTEALGCPLQSWEVFREYDYRSSMSPATFDVTRRLVYQIVTMRVPHVDPSIRYYIHAVNAMEAKPKFDFDTQLERMVFNAVWDFGRSRMVALSCEELDARLDFTLVSFNTSTGSLVVQQAHYPLLNQISAAGSLVSSGLASADGMGTVDILYGTYYTVVPAALETSTQIVHAVVAIDIDTKRVIQAITLPVTLMNLQINSLQHTLYGAGADLTGTYGYYELCKATSNTTETEGLSVSVDCAFAELSPLPEIVNHLYLQSATIDHHVNYAWFAYKEQATGRPLILEYHQSTSDYVLWRQDSLPLEAAFSSLIQTAPRIIFSLYPPAIRSARFSTSGTTIFVEFEAPTLRGAVPIDANGDELPDYWNDEDKLTRTPCEFFFDDFTMRTIPGSMCQWTSDSNMYIELNEEATIMPGDLIRIRGNRLWAGRRTPGGVNLFSQPSTDFAVVLVPLDIPFPTVRIGGNVLIDTCTPLVLDGSESSNHGFRGTFLWTLNRTEPEKPEPHVRETERVLADIQDVPISPRIITIPSGTFEGGTKYFITLTVFSLWDINKHTSLTHGVMVSQDPIPPLIIFGASYRTVRANEAVRIGALLSLEGCLNSTSASEVRYEFVGCLSSQATDVFQGVIGCPEWDPSIARDRVTGALSRSLYIEPYTLDPLQEYMFTVRGSVNSSSGILQNVASITIFVELSELVLEFHGGDGFSAARNQVIAVDAVKSRDPADPLQRLATFAFEFSCEVSATGEPCWPNMTATPQLPTVPCDAVQQTFVFRGMEYSHAEATTHGNLLANRSYCMANGSVLIQPNSLPVGVYLFQANVTKVVEGITRRSYGTCVVTILEPNAGTTTQGGAVEAGSVVEQTPQVVITVESPMPFVPSEALRAFGTVTNPRNTTSYSYSWTLEQYAVNPDYDPDRALTDPLYDVPELKFIPLDVEVLNPDDPADLATAPGTPYFVIPPGVLFPGMEYRLRLDVTDSVLSFRDTPDSIGYAYVNLPAFGLPPSGGRLEASALSGMAFDTMFTFTMAGWGSDDLPLLYQFGYQQDYTDSFADMTYFTSIWNQRGVIETYLPPGGVMPSNLLRVFGMVRSSYGAITTASVDLSVVPPANASMRERIVRSMREMDTETALLAAAMLVQDAGPNSVELADILNASLAAGIMNFSYIPNTALAAVRAASLLNAMCDKGLYSQLLLDNTAELANRSIAEGFIRPMLVSVEDIVRPLLSTYDCFLPGVYPSALRRRLQAQSVAVDVVDYRALELRHTHHLQVRSLERTLCSVLLQQVYPQEAPLTYLMRGHNLFIGKELSHAEGLLQRHSWLQNSFSIPSLDSSGMPPIFTYRYLEYNKYPFIFMALPDNRTLLTPRDSLDEPGRRIPLQGYPTDQRLWHAMSLDITDEFGQRVNDLVSASLANATFNVLPRIISHPQSSRGTFDYAATCYIVDVGENLSGANYDPRGVVYSDDSCVTKRLPDFAVLLDDLAVELEQMEVSASDFLGSYLDGYRSLAMVGMIVFTLLVALAAAACAFYVDAIEPEEAEAIDDVKRRVIERADPKEKLVDTLIFTFKRDHLLVGIWTKHRRVTREKRVEIILLAWLATEAVTTVMNTRLRFKAEKHLVAIGLVAGVLVFPLTQFVQFLFDWCPQTRGKLAFAPHSSTPAKPIPLKQQAQVPHIQKPRKPGIPQQVLPPPPGAPLRTTVGVTPPPLPPALPLELPALQQGDNTKQILPPPRQQRQPPRPPKEPPPAQHLVAARSPTGSLALAKLKPAATTQALKGTGPFGLTLPELPPLPISTNRLESGEVPAPPPKRAGAGPKPPQTPPPLTKMFFAVPQNGQLRVPPVPPLKAAGGPKLPPIPKLTRPQEMFGLVKIAGRDLASAARPPPPPPKETLRHFPAPPITPREEAESEGWPEGAPTPNATGLLALPGAPEPSEHSASASASASAAAPAGLDVEETQPPSAVLQPEAGHGMMRPLRNGPAPGSASGSGGSPAGITPPGTAAPAPSAGGTAPPPPPPPPPRGSGASRPPPGPPPRPQGGGSSPVPPGGLPALPPPPRLSLGSEAAPGSGQPSFSGPLALRTSQGLPNQNRSVPALPKHLPLQLPSTALMKVPAIRPHVDGEDLVPPPPPPRLALPGWDAAAPPLERRELPTTQQLRPYKPPSLSSRPLPQPPPKLPNQALLPTPPAGPPPAHAVILAKKTAISSADEEALIKRAKPPPMVPKLPEETLPPFVRRNVVSEAETDPKRPVGFREDERAAKVHPGRFREKPLKVVPDWVLQASYWSVQTFVAGCILGACFFIIYWGVYLESRAQWATHGASVVGCIMNFGVFESMKCVVITCVNLIKSETEKRQEELNARKVRMAFKAQRLQERAGKKRRTHLLKERTPHTGLTPVLDRGLRMQT